MTMSKLPGMSGCSVTSVEFFVVLHHEVVELDRKGYPACVALSLAQDVCTKKE